MSREDEGGDQGEAPTSQGHQRSPVTPEVRREAWHRRSLTASEGTHPADTLISTSSLRSCETIHLLFKPHNLEFVTGQSRELTRGLPKDPPSELRPEQEGPRNDGGGTGKAGWGPEHRLHWGWGGLGGGGQGHGAGCVELPRTGLGVGKVSPEGGEAPGGHWAGSYLSVLSEETTLEVNTCEGSATGLEHTGST